MKTEGHTADTILKEQYDVSSSYFWKSLAWIDLAKRTRAPGCLHYAALELRMGVEYLLFELLVLSTRSMTESDYSSCLGDPAEMKKRLRSVSAQYEKRAAFTRILLSFDSTAPKVRFWNINDLFRYWGIASALLHFVGSHSRTHASDKWFIESLARTETAANAIWQTITTTVGAGLFAEDRLRPEIRQTYRDFIAGVLSEVDLKVRLRILRSRMAEKYGRTMQLWVHRPAAGR